MIFHNLSKKLIFFLGEKKYQIIMTEPNPNIYLLFYYDNEKGILEVSKDEITFKFILKPLDFCFHYDIAGVSFPEPITTIMIDEFKRKIENNESCTLHFDKYGPSYIKYYNDFYLCIVTENAIMKLKINDKNMIYEMLDDFKHWINELIDG